MAYRAAHKDLIDYMVAHGYSVKISAYGEPDALIEVDAADVDRYVEADLYDACRAAYNVQILFAKDGVQHWALVSVYDLDPEETVIDFGDGEFTRAWFNDYFDRAYGVQS